MITIPYALQRLEFCGDRLIVAGMITILSAIVSLASFRFRRRVFLELEVLALRHLCLLKTPTSAKILEF